MIFSIFTPILFDYFGVPLAQNVRSAPVRRIFLPYCLDKSRSRHFFKLVLHHFPVFKIRIRRGVWANNRALMTHKLKTTKNGKKSPNMRKFSTKRKWNREKNGQKTPKNWIFPISNFISGVFLFPYLTFHFQTTISRNIGNFTLQREQKFFAQKVSMKRTFCRISKH